MLTYEYVARDSGSGKKITGTVQADDERAVAKIVREQGYALISAKPEGGGFGLGFIKSRVRVKDKIIFSRQLSTLINAGLPVVQSLTSVTNQTKSRQLKIVLSDVIQNVESGKSFADSLSKHPRVFDQIFVSLVAAGEASGTLDAALERVAEQQEKDAEIISKVRGAMVYPAIVLLVMGAVVGFMVIAVLPQVGELYRGLPGAQLPLQTRALLAISDFAVKFWWLVLIGVGVMIFMTTKYARTAGGKEVIDKLKLTMPPVNKLFQKVYMARFTRTATTLVASGVPLLQVMEITSRAISNVHIERSINRATERVKGGKALSESLANEEEFLELVPQMIKIGEDSGSLEKMLAKTADYYEKEVDDQIKTISTIIEPTMMVILGVVALILVSAILLPIYGLVGQDI